MKTKPKALIWQPIGLFGTNYRMEFDSENQVLVNQFFPGNNRPAVWQVLHDNTQGGAYYVAETPDKKLSLYAGHLLALGLIAAQEAGIMHELEKITHSKA